jgi:hypothetical protein
MKIPNLTVSLPHNNTSQLQSDSFLSYLITSFQLQRLHNFKSDHMLMNDEYLRIWKEPVIVYSKASSRICVETEKWHRNQMWDNYTEL